MSVADAVDLTSARAEIGALVLRRAMQRGDAAWEAKVLAAHVALLQAMSAEPGTDDGGAAWRAALRQFHLALGAACGSARLQAFYMTLYGQSEASLTRAPCCRDRLFLRQLVAAVLQRNVPEAEALIRASAAGGDAATGGLR